MQTILLFGCILLGGFFLADAAMYYLSGQSGVGKKRIDRRLKGEARKEEEKRKSILRESIENQDIFFVDRYLGQLILHADSQMTIRSVYIFTAAMTLAIAGAMFMFFPILPLILCLFSGLAFAFALIILVLKRQIKARNYKFEEQFPDAIELIVRSLRVGQPFTKAIVAVANEMPDPVAKEFKITSQEIAYGRNLPEALDDMITRIDVPDLKFFVVAVQIQHESGGNLAEILENLSKIIRGRFRLMRKVKALTVEGRFSAWFLSFFPVFMIFIMNSINPGYYQKVADYPLFPHLVGVTVVLLIINVIAMRIMTKLEV
jgi:tight adherence protein B